MSDFEYAVPVDDIIEYDATVDGHGSLELTYPAWADEDLYITLDFEELEAAYNIAVAQRAAYRKNQKETNV